MLQIREFLQGHLAGTLPGACRQPSYLTPARREAMSLLKSLSRTVGID